MMKIQLLDLAEMLMQTVDSKALKLDFLMFRILKILNKSANHS